MLHHIGQDTHVGRRMSAFRAGSGGGFAVMEAAEDPFVPSSMTLMGGPIDTRINPTAVNQLAMERPLKWFKDNVIMTVPWPQAGFMRPVYPGFLQLSGFMSMNLDRHLIAHKQIL